MPSHLMASGLTCLYFPVLPLGSFCDLLNPSLPNLVKNYIRLDLFPNLKLQIQISKFRIWKRKSVGLQILGKKKATAFAPHCVSSLNIKKSIFCSYQFGKRCNQEKGWETFSGQKLKFNMRRFTPFIGIPNFTVQKKQRKMHVKFMFDEEWGSKSRVSYQVKKQTCKNSSNVSCLPFSCHMGLSRSTLPFFFLFLSPGVSFSNAVTTAPLTLPFSFLFLLCHRSPSSVNGRL